MEVIVRQISGLGNQLFQYAAGLYFARSLHASLRLAIDMPQNQVSHGYARPFLLSHFQIPVPLQPITASERALLSPRFHARLVAAWLRATGTELITEQLSWRHHFQPALPTRPTTRRLVLAGYWQAWQYPQAVEAELRRDLAFRQPAAGQTLQFLNHIQATPLAVSLHVRRGDYTTAAEGNKVLPLDYYRAAAAHFHHLGDPTFFVFSDDLAWCREVLAPALPAATRLVFVEGNNDHTAHEDLRLMSACHHHILANSSFSWWGAWLNPRAEKQIFAPRYWLLTPDSYYPDTTPPHWHLWPAESSHARLP